VSDSGYREPLCGPGGVQWPKRELCRFGSARVKIDDLASLGLDVLVAEAGFAHHAPNPLLLVG